MAVLTLGADKTTAGTMIYEAALEARDSSTVTTAGLSVAQYIALINKRYYWWTENIEKRSKDVTLVTSYAATDMSKVSDATAIYPEILGLYIAATGGLGFTERELPLERMGWNELRQLQFDASGAASTFDVTIDGAGGVKYPRFYALEKLQGASGKWQVALWDTTVQGSVVVVKAKVRDYPTALAATGDTPDVGDFESRVIAQMAGMDAARMLGDADLAAQIKAELPPYVQDKMAVSARQTGPERRTQAVT